MYSLYIPPHLDKVFFKLAKKDKKQLHIIHNKIKEILETPDHYKPLRGDKKGSRRVHIDSHFVLIYEVDEQQKQVRLLDYDHHDNIYE